jgi:hypothetical protein
MFGARLSDGSGGLTGFAQGTLRCNLDFISASDERIAASHYLTFVDAGQRIIAWLAVSYM